MTFLILHHVFMPKYYDQLGIKENDSIAIMWLLREILDAVPSVKESIPQDVYKELYHCMHFVDDWKRT